MAESFLGLLWFANSKSLESNSACLSGQHAIQCRSWQSQTHSFQNTRQKGNGTLVTRLECILYVWERNRVFLYLSSAIWQFIFIFLSHTMTSVENPLLVPPYAAGHRAQWCAQLSWFQQVCPGHTPAGGTCSPWRTVGLELVPPEAVQ